MDAEKMIELPEKVKKLLENNKIVPFVDFDEEIKKAIIDKFFLPKEFYEKKGQQVEETLHTLIIKIEALRYHSKRFIEIENSRKKEIVNDSHSLIDIKKGIIKCEVELLCEFEAFHFQVKALLDVLVQVLGLIMEPGSIKKSYGDYGDKVIKYLENKKRNKNYNSEKFDPLIKLISASRLWLKPLIDYRRDMIHYRSLMLFGFHWDSEKNMIKPPSAKFGESEKPISEILTITTEQMLKFTGDFISRAIYCISP